MFRDVKFKILIVEDDGFLRDLLSRKLTHEQHNLLIAADGEEGLELATSEHPSIILLDLLLPGMNGFEVLEKIRANPDTKDIPVLVLSNLGQESDIKKAKRIGADEFLIKSNFSIDEVVTKMKAVIKEKQKQVASAPAEAPGAPGPAKPQTDASETAQQTPPASDGAASGPAVPPPPETILTDTPGQPAAPGGEGASDDLYRRPPPSANAVDGVEFEVPAQTEQDSAVPGASDNTGARPQSPGNPPV